MQGIDWTMVGAIAGVVAAIAAIIALIWRRRAGNRVRVRNIHGSTVSGGSIGKTSSPKRGASIVDAEDVVGSTITGDDVRG